MSNYLHCCHCGRFSLMLSRHDKCGYRIDYSYCSHCRTLDLIGHEVPLGDTRTEYFFTYDYEHLERDYYFRMLYGKGA